MEEENDNSPSWLPKNIAHELSNIPDMQHKADTVRNILRKEGYSPKVPQAVHVNKATLEEISNWQHNTKSWISRLKNDEFTLCM